MKKTRIRWKIPVTGALVLATAVSAEQGRQTRPDADQRILLERDQQPDLDSTNRVTVSLRMGFNIKGGFRGTGSTFALGAPLSSPQFTSRGDRYNYDNGYVLPDKIRSKDGYTWYWGYDNAGQIDAANSTIAFQKTSAAGLPRGGDSDDTPYYGVDVAYDYLLHKDEDHHLYYGLEVGANWMPISFGGNGRYNLSLSQTTDTYSYTPGTTPPGYLSGDLPYQGSYQGPGFVLNYPRVGRSTALAGSATLLVQQDFDSDLWGFRVGPYVDYMPATNVDLHVSGGFAMGILTANASWKETLIPNGGGVTTSLSGSGNDVGWLGGFYVGMDAEYRFNHRWSALAGVQFQDLGNYNHNFGGRSVDLDLSQSVFVNVGISYSF
jgi:hypothetical protein